jgi:hypothetical protein
LTKRIHIREPFDDQYHVLGIASDAHIWKLCWEINQLLELNLVKKEKEAPQREELNRAEEVLASLFKENELQPPSGVQHYYEDLESERNVEYTLFESDRSLSPKEAKPFRYFLMIMSTGEYKPDLAPMILRLNQSEIILSSVDISDIKNIKNILF